MEKEDNLTPWPPGTSGNPKGRPEGSLNIKTLIEKIFNEEIELDDPIIGKIAKKKIIEHGLRRQAIRWINGDNQAGKDLLDRKFGKPLETTTMKFTGIDDEKDIIDYSKLTEEEAKKLVKEKLNEVDKDL